MKSFIKLELKDKEYIHKLEKQMEILKQTITQLTELKDQES